jgi:hypothetical protein
MTAPAATAETKPAEIKEVIRTEQMTKAERRQLKACQEARDSVGRLLAASKAMAAQLTQANADLPAAAATLYEMLSKRLGYASHAALKADGLDVGIDAKSGTVSLVRKAVA